jgi:uncharacterized protein YjbI with pentapeptide repeats
MGGDGKVDLAELERYVTKTVREESKKDYGDERMQTPHLYMPDLPGSAINASQWVLGRCRYTEKPPDFYTQKNRKGETFEAIDLSGEVLDGYDFSLCKFIRVNFSNAQIRGVETYFFGATFEGCNLTGLDCGKHPIGLRYAKFKNSVGTPKWPPGDRPPHFD